MPALVETMHYIFVFVYFFPRSPPCGAHHVCDSVLSAVQMLSAPPFTNTVEQVFVLGGTEVYRVTQHMFLLQKFFIDS